MMRSVTVSLYVVVSLLMAPLGAHAQPRGLEVFPPHHPGARHDDQGARPGPPVRDLYPARPAVPDAVEFVVPLSRERATTRAGIAAWTAPNVPTGSRGAADPDNPGWLGFGFAAQWGSPAGRARN